MKSTKSSVVLGILLSVFFLSSTGGLTQARADRLSTIVAASGKVDPDHEDKESDDGNDSANRFLKNANREIEYSSLYEKKLVSKQKEFIEKVGKIAAVEKGMCRKYLFAGKHNRRIGRSIVAMGKAFVEEYPEYYADQEEKVELEKKLAFLERKLEYRKQHPGSTREILMEKIVCRNWTHMAKKGFNRFYTIVDFFAKANTLFTFQGNWDRTFNPEKKVTAVK